MSGPRQLRATAMPDLRASFKARVASPVRSANLPSRLAGRPGQARATGAAKRRPPEEQRPAGPQLYVAAMTTWSRQGQPVRNPGGLARSVAVLLEVVDCEVLALRRVRKTS